MLTQSGAIIVAETGGAEVYRFPGRDGGLYPLDVGTELSAS